MPHVKSKQSVTAASNEHAGNPPADQIEKQRGAPEEKIAQVAAIAYETLARRLDLPDAMDVAQDIALESLMQIRSGGWTTPTIGLVRHRALARAVDLLREEKRRRVREQKHGAAYYARTPTWADPYKTFEERRMMSCFEHAFEQLTPACGRVFLMIRGESMSYGEVAAKLRISRSAVCALMVRAQRGLRRAFAEQGIEVPGPRNGPPVRPVARVQRPTALAEPWAVRTAQGLLHDAGQYFRRELEKREQEEAARG
jgi:RNA polymerase sigma factor (sigma-70 family)